MATLKANPSSIASGQSSTLTWTTSNANVVTLDGTNVPSSGTLVVLPTATHTYNIVAQNSTGSVSTPATVTVATGTTSDPPTTTATTPTIASGTRDPAYWPFAQTSVWNYPIGSNATYATIQKGDGSSGWDIPSLQVGNYTSTVYISQPTDPLTNFFGFGPSDCKVYNVSCTNESTIARRAPAAISIAPGEPTLAVVSVDHLTAYEFGPGACYSSTGFNGLGAGYYNGNGGSDPTNCTSYGQTCCDSINIDLKGPGIWLGLNNTIGDTWPSGVCEFNYPCGDMGIYLNQGEEATPTPAHAIASGTPYGASSAVRGGRTPQIAGTIRQGELLNGIHHALAGGTDASKYNRNTPGGYGYRWPASAADSFEGTLYGTQGNIYIGSLVAIPSSVNLDNYTWTTVQGLNLAKAFQNYGEYLLDSTSTAGIWLDYTARSEVPSGAGWSADLAQIKSLIQVVTNSAHGDGSVVGGFKLDGGDGAVNQNLLAPPFDAKWGGGNGRSSYFIPRIPRSIWAWVTRGMLP